MIDVLDRTGVHLQCTCSVRAVWAACYSFHGADEVERKGNSSALPDDMGLLDGNGKLL